RWLRFDAADVRRAAVSVVTNYRTALAGFAEMSVLETWYAKVSMDEVFQEYARDPKIAKHLLKSVEQAKQNTTEHVFHKITDVENGKPRIHDQPPLLFHADASELDLERDVRPFFANYRGTLSAEREALFDRFHLVDIAHKVVGVGSVGTRCFVALFCGDQDDHLFLQVKEARPSVLEGLAGHSPFANNGERVVTGQRLMQSASDIFLGWTRAMHVHDFYVLQMRDMKIAPDLTGYSPRILAGYGRLCGRALARAHAKAGDAATIAGYLGSTDVFDEAVADYALAYADQVEKDYASFRAAIRAGRAPGRNRTRRPAGRPSGGAGFPARRSRRGSSRRSGDGSAGGWSRGVISSEAEAPAAVGLSRRTRFFSLPRKGGGGKNCGRALRN